MTPEQREQRAAHCRAIAGRGGQATYQAHGREHMARIGKRGFQVALELGWGEWLWQTTFRLTYEGRVGHPRPQPARTEQARADQRVRDEARRRYTPLGRCSWPGCGEPAQHRHHITGVRVPDANDHVVTYCLAHHTEAERAKRLQRRQGRQAGQSHGQ